MRPAHAFLWIVVGVRGRSCCGFPCCRSPHHRNSHPNHGVHNVSVSDARLQGIYEIRVVNEGSGCTNAETDGRGQISVRIQPENAARATAYTVAGKVTRVQVDRAGSGFTEPPVLSVAGCEGLVLEAIIGASLSVTECHEAIVGASLSVIECHEAIVVRH